MKTYMIPVILLMQTMAYAQEPAGNPWTMNPDPNAKITFQNPVIPGFYSDPSICRVGEDYYLVTSTFEFFPGVPVFHSKDLIHWEQIGHVMHRREQVPRGINIFAPTLRYHRGVFYMITTNIAGGGNFYVTAKNPTGPWSDPVFVEVQGIDPDLYFDEDGKTYVISSSFVLSQIDLETGKLIGEQRKVWNGTGGRYPEGPHIYKKDGYYYLMAAEGGTEEAHQETIARSNSIWGPYTENPANPILAHANAAGQGNPIQGVGHADMIQAHDGSWWMVFHGYRSVTGYPAHHILGRETCLAPVSWPTSGWPVVNGNGVVQVNMTCPTLPQKPFSPGEERIDFDKPLGLEWNYLQPPVETNYQVGLRQLILNGAAGRIGEAGSPTFVGRRLTDVAFTATTRLEFSPTQESEEAGIILLNNGTHFDLMVVRQKKKRYVIVKLQFGQTHYQSKPVMLEDGPVDLRISGHGPTFSFAFAQGNETFRVVDRVDARFLSTETLGWFTGVYVGLYATGNGEQSKAPANFDWFQYAGN